jgi:hypothetical protein
MIHLRNAGVFQPAPRLESFAQSVSDELQTWPGMIAALFAVVTDRDCGKPTRAGFAGRLDHQRHIRRVLDLEVKAVVPTSGLFEDLKDGLHYATFASSASGIAACSAVGGCNAARMTAEVCWMTSRLSAKSEALP